MFPALENIRVPTFDKRASREECSRIVPNRRVIHRLEITPSK